jgi:uncharacterized membrane protein YphA (DoxX/SURF4 family)
MKQLTSNAKALAGLRIAVGVLFLIFAEYKVFGAQFTTGGGFQFWVTRFLQDGAYPWMVPVLRDFVLPHARAIAFLVAYGELAIGLSLVFGILVRTASICGFIYMLTLLLPRIIPDRRRHSGNISELLWSTWCWHFVSRHLLWEMLRRRFRCAYT